MGPCYAVNEAISRDNLFEKALSGHPLILDVSADKASANRSSWNDVPRLWTAGVPMTFSLTLSDKFGNVVSYLRVNGFQGSRLIKSALRNCSRTSGLFEQIFLNSHPP